MASYIERALGANERVVHQAKVHWAVFIWPFFWTVISMGLLLPLTAVWFLAALFRLLNTELAVTDKRLIAKTGFISRRVIEQRLAKVDAIRIDQGIFGRILGYGTVFISGSGISTTPFRNIADPMGFKRAAEEQIERYEAPPQAASA